MSYAISAPLQAAIYSALQGDIALNALVGSAVFDQAPAGAIDGTYISLGEEVARDASDCSGVGAVHDFTVTVVTDEAGFVRAKEVAGAVCDVLIDAELPLDRGSLVGLNFVSARAQRTKADHRRRIDLRFRARVED